MSQVGDSTEGKFVARRLGVFVTIALILTGLWMRPTIEAEIDLAMNPPIPQPPAVYRIERESADCWDVLNVRRDPDLNALVLTLTEVCNLDPVRFPRVLRELQLWLQTAYSGEKYFVTEWVFKQGKEFVIRSLTICNGLEAVVDILTAHCPTQGVERVVPQKEWRRWWVEDYNPEFRRR